MFHLTTITIPLDVLSNVLYQSATIYFGGTMEQHQLHVRLDENIIEGMSIYKRKHRRSYAWIVEDALRDYLAKHDIPVEQPSTDV